jgi:hypothetical protein
MRHETRPRCPDCGGGSFAQFDEGPLQCLACGTEWLVAGINYCEGCGAPLVWGVCPNTPHDVPWPVSAESGSS